MLSNTKQAVAQQRRNCRIFGTKSKHAEKRLKKAKMCKL